MKLDSHQHATAQVRAFVTDGLVVENGRTAHEHASVLMDEEAGVFVLGERLVIPWGP